MADLYMQTASVGEGEEYELHPTSAARLYDPKADKKIVDWRLLILLEAGFSELDASTLSVRRDVDLHEATRLVANGATSVQARDILL